MVNFKSFILCLLVLLISSVNYVLDEDLLKLLLTGHSATYNVYFVKHNYSLVFGLSTMVIVFGFFSKKMKWAQYILGLSLVFWLLSLRTYAIIKDDNIIIVKGVTFVSISKCEVSSHDSNCVGMFDFFLKSELENIIHNELYPQ